MAIRILCLLAIASLLVASCSPNAAQPTDDDGAASADEESSESIAEGEIQWIDLNKVEPGPIRRDKLTDEQMARIESLQKTFLEVNGQTVEQWADNFKRDLNPDRELAIWERMAKAYTAYCSRRDLDLDAKKEVFKVVLLRSMASQEDVLQRLDLKIISRDDAIEIMKGF
jgi:hypothetical protein